MLESIIKDELFRHFDLNNLFTAYQHGFWRGYSCVTQLINVMEDWHGLMPLNVGKVLM